MISSYVGENKEFERQYLAGELELEFTPQGTLAERCAPAAPASRPSSRAPASARCRRGQGDARVRRRHLRDGARPGADVSLVKAWKADTEGNLVFRKTARNFNPAGGDGRQGDVAEVEEIVEPARSTPTRPPARHLRAPHRAQRHAREAHRAAHHARPN
jgi:3-oxoacid CoA-transferase subunit A